MSSLEQGPTPGSAVRSEPGPPRCDYGPTVITGAGRGIGQAIARRLAADGAPVCLAARTRGEIDETADLIRADGGTALAIPCDVTADGEVERLIEAAAHEFGGLSILVNNAGGAHRVQPLEQLDPRTIELGTQLNYTAVWRAMRAAAPHLFEAAPHASVLNIVSIGAERGLAGMSYYSGAKAAVVAMSRAVAREWGPRGVRVNCLGPGWISTQLSRPLFESAEFADRTLHDVPLGRWGEPEEIADAAAFLVSPAARYVTGTTLFVDGGLLA
jgi:NAD(P)-dependent dehydrogenase (short-subunit alcohol dehydrogenase family)